MKTQNNKLLKSVLLGAVALGLSSTMTVAQDKKSNMLTEDRDVEAFTKVYQGGSFDVEVEVGPSRSVEVKAHSKIMEYIETYVEDGTLIVREKERKRRGITGLFGGRNYRAIVYITVPSLEGFDSRGSGDAYVEGIKADHFDFAQRGSGDVELTGTCKTGEFSMRGSGDVDAKDFECGDVDISLSGSGDARVFASGDVKVSSRGSGDVDIYGGGNLTDVRTRGSGDVETHN